MNAMNHLWQRLNPRVGNTDNSIRATSRQRWGISSNGGTNGIATSDSVSVEVIEEPFEGTALLSESVRMTAAIGGLNHMSESVVRSPTDNDIERVENGDNEVTAPLQPNGDSGANGSTNNSEHNDTNTTNTANNNNNDNNRPDMATATVDPITSITNRLRCLFACITLPILPLGTLLVLLLINLLYAGLQEINLNCSHFDDSMYSNAHQDEYKDDESTIISHYHPLKAYALSSLLLSLYAPQHKQVKQYLFGYVRERDGPNRPAAVRIYDQLFYLLCFWYIYSGTLIIQSCKGDIVTMKDNGADHPMDLDMDLSMCQINCPKLYAATRGYVVTLQIFGLVLLLPLICLPFVYLWIVRRVSSDDARDWFSRNGGDGEDPLSLNGDRIMVKDIMDNLEEVTVMRMSGPNEGGKMVKVIPNGTKKEQEEKLLEEELVKDCCICMNQFDIQDTEASEVDVESLMVTRKGNGDKQSRSDEDDHDYNDGKPLINATSSISIDDETIVMTKCGHLFHRSCLGSWVSGNWRESNGRAHSRFCPLCREDLAPSRDDTTE